MQYRTLGKTGCRLSVIGFGASPLGNVFGDVDSAASEEAVRLSIDQGINLFDVSPYYGLTLAEERLGTALGSQRQQVFLATKCGRYGEEQFDFSAGTIVREFEQSLRRLKTDYVDLLQVHDVEFGKQGQLLSETLPALHRLKEQGKIRFLGVTAYWPGLLARVMAKADLDCVLNYCHANLFADDVDAALIPAVQQKGTGLLNASPMHMGLLSDRSIPSWHPAPPNVREAALQVRSVCARYGVNPGTLALRVCLEHPVVCSTLVGLSSAAEVSAACAALAWTIPPDLSREVQRIIRPVHNTTWPSGFPENQDAPFDEA